MKKAAELIETTGMKLRGIAVGQTALAGSSVDENQICHKIFKKMKISARIWLAGACYLCSE